MKPWSNLAKLVYMRTYARKKDDGSMETWSDTVDRVIAGNTKNFNVSEDEKNKLTYYLKARKAGPAGRGYWFSGTKAHSTLGGVALNNCWGLSADDWQNFVVAQELLMLGGGVGLSVEHKFTSKLPKVKRDVSVTHKGTKDADYIVPDSREGWCELFRRVLESFFVTGRSFTFSTVCVRGYGETIAGFGGTASGPLPLIMFIANISRILTERAGKHVRPIDAMDIICATGEMVVSGNVRRSAIIILGDPWDKEYLRSKRWDLGPVPTYRSCANLSVVCDDVEDLHPYFWKTYENGEPFGIINRKNIQQYGRIGELKKDTAYLVNPCSEATLECFEPCNLQNIPLMNLEGEDEFVDVARLMHRYGKRVAMEHYHIPEVNAIVHKNYRIGTSITGCLGSPLFNPKTLDRVYSALQHENAAYAKELGVAESIRLTTLNPGGSVSKIHDQNGYEGIHAAYSRYIIQRIRFSSNDPLIPILKQAGHYMEPVVKFDGSVDRGTMVVDFYVKAEGNFPVADENWSTWQQLDVLKMAQKHWADQAVSVTVYYKKEDIPALKKWLGSNLQYLKTISFLCHSDHGFKQAPKEAITKEQYEQGVSRIKSIDFGDITEGELEVLGCEGGMCPIK